MVIHATEETPFGQMARQMSRLMDQLQKGFMSYRTGETWAPSVNVYENESAYVVCVDLAGVEKDKIDLQVSDGQLRLKGARPVPAHPEAPEAASRQGRWRVHLMEIDNGSFCRAVDLPADVAADRISASYCDGLLWIDIPKK
jgi:HSP20 family protein